VGNEEKCDFEPDVVRGGVILGHSTLLILLLLLISFGRGGFWGLKAIVESGNPDAPVFRIPLTGGTEFCESEPKH
jgi:hypothetical protein